MQGYHFDLFVYSVHQLDQIISDPFGNRSASI